MDLKMQRAADIFEVTADKRIVWQVTGSHIGQVTQCQLLPDDLAKPSAPMMLGKAQAEQSTLSR
jgi:hypothetical protein